VVDRTVLPLTPEPAGLTADALPAPGGRAAFKLAAAALPQVPDILKGQVVLSATGPDGALTDATSAQLAGGLDDLATYTDPFGPSFNQRTPTPRPWAPTSRSVNVRHDNARGRRRRWAASSTGGSASVQAPWPCSRPAPCRAAAGRNRGMTGA
jgi:hypothetical protein